MMTRSVCHSCLLREAIHCAVGVLDRVALSSTGRVTVVDEDMIAEENIWIAVAAAVDEWNHRRHHYDLSCSGHMNSLQLDWFVAVAVVVVAAAACKHTAAVAACYHVLHKPC